MLTILLLLGLLCKISIIFPSNKIDIIPRGRIGIRLIQAISEIALTPCAPLISKFAQAHQKAAIMTKNNPIKADPCQYSMTNIISPASPNITIESLSFVICSLNNIVARIIVKIVWLRRTTAETLTPNPRFTPAN